jgi:DNA-binding response OmpR family regulator
MDRLKGRAASRQLDFGETIPRAEPFPPREEASFWCGRVRIDLETFLAVRGGELVSIRPQEARLLALLLRHEGRIVKYQDILQALYGDGVPQDLARPRLKSLVADIRRRFGSEVRVTLQTIRGHGLALRTNPPVAARSHAIL